MREGAGRGHRGRDGGRGNACGRSILFQTLS